MKGSVQSEGNFLHIFTTVDSATLCHIKETNINLQSANMRKRIMLTKLKNTAANFEKQSYLDSSGEKIYII